MCYIQYCFFLSGGGVDDVFSEVVVNETNYQGCHLMCISFSLKHPQIFCESWMSLSNMSKPISNIYTNPSNTQLVIKTSVENHDKKPKDERNYVDHYFLNGYVYFSLG